MSPSSVGGAGSARGGPVLTARWAASRRGSTGLMQMPGRDNGFVARHYVPLADLDPRLAEAMLDALKVEGIAAYVVPSTGRLGGYLEVHLPERPRDQLWVDREYHDRATALLDAHRVAESSPVEGASDPLVADASAPTSADTSADAPSIDALTPSTDDAWASIVAAFDSPAFSGAAPWPTAEDLPPDADDGSAVSRRVIRPADRAADTDRNPIVPSPTEPLDAFDAYDPLSILDEHFVPDVPPPLPRLRRGTRWALASIAIGIVLLVTKSFSDAVPYAVTLGLLAIAGGLVALFARIRDDGPDGSDSNDGAVV